MKTALDNRHTSLLEPAADESARQPVRVVLILGALSAFGPLSIDMYLPSLPELTRDLATGASQVQLTLSACLLGLAAGQALAGPLSDVLGRRRPLAAGVASFALVSLLCAAAPNIAALIVLRFVQGFAGAAGIVIARAIARDLHQGAALARFLSLLMLVTGLAPITAPLIGGQVLRFTSWRGVFVVLAAIGAVLVVSVLTGLPETLPEQRRQPGSVRATGATAVRVLADRRFVGFALCGGLAMGSMFAYIAGSPFVLQDIYGVSPQLFGIFFGANALGIVTASQINARLVGRIAPRRILAAGLATAATGALALLLVVASGGIGLPGILPALFVVVACIGFIGPNATALALGEHGRTAGTASALLGILQFSIGAFTAPLVGVAGSGTALPMALVMAAMSGSAFGAYLLLARAQA